MTVCPGVGEKGTGKSLPVVKTHINFPAYELIEVSPVFHLCSLLCHPNILAGSDLTTFSASFEHKQSLQVCLMSTSQILPKETLHSSAIWK